MVVDRFLGILLVRSRPGTILDLDDNLLTIEQRCSLLQAEAFGFDDEDVTEEQLEGEPTAIEDLR